MHCFHLGVRTSAELAAVRCQTGDGLDKRCASVSQKADLLKEALLTLPAAVPQQSYDASRELNTMGSVC